MTIKNIDKTPLGDCPLCKDGKIKENSKAYFCSNWKNNCNFTLWKNSIPELGEDISRDAVAKLLDAKQEGIEIESKDNKSYRLKFKSEGNGEIELF